MTEIEPPRAFCSAERLNHPGIGAFLAIARLVFDEICRAVPLPQAIEKDLVDAYRSRISMLI